ncbi:DUF4234 domain-containing protein [Geodermatophilus sp. CPCC 206100]|uniref:DUF4234 domain-containing protein n=1 Tax=Geodermatophilus sp. CPCC 206100 TaxID=3020054 RepID=UPI003AFF8812
MTDPLRKQPPPPPPGYAPQHDPGQQPAYPPPHGYDPQGNGQLGSGPPAYGAPPPGYSPMPGAPAGYAAPTGPPGLMRPTGMTMLLFFVTFGIWGFIYYFQVHEEMRRHSGQGLGGVLALVIAIVFGIVSPFLLSHEVGQLYERRGQRPPVSALTALWFFPGVFILVGPFIWFVRTNRALNDYWASLGVRETTLV